MRELETRGETTDDAINQVRDLGKRFSDRLTVNNLRLAERYRKGELDLWIGLAPIDGQGLTKYVAIFQHAGVSAGVYEVQQKQGASLGRDVRGGRPDEKPCNLATASDHQQQAMLVNVVHVAEAPGQFVPSLVRLYRFDDALRGRGDARYFSLRSGVVVSLGLLAEWEAGVLPGVAAIGFDQLPSQVVKGGPQVVGGVSNDQRNDGRDLGSELNPMDYIPRLRITLGDKTIAGRVVPNDGQDFPFQITDVLFGPFNFRAALPESRNGSENSGTVGPRMDPGSLDAVVAGILKDARQPLALPEIERQVAVQGFIVDTFAVQRSVRRLVKTGRAAVTPRYLVHAAAQ